MPPGQRRPRLNGTTVAGLVNSSTQSDEEARRRVKFFFGSILAALFLVDVGCALLVVYIQCKSGDEHDHGHEMVEGDTAKCVSRAIGHGFLSFRPIPTTTSGGQQQDQHERDYLGDLFVSAFYRCVLMSLLLVAGIHFGRHRHSEARESVAAVSTPDTNGTNGESNNTAPNDSNEDDLAEPLLNNASITDTAQSDIDELTSSIERQAPTGRNGICSSCCSAGPSRRVHSISPSLAKNIVLVILFALSATFQVYAGLKVATYPAEQTIVACIPLMCLTILWINAEAYVFRTILSELTREKGLFLPPEVHRHPVFLEKSRSMAFHWCDLCRQRIKADDGGVYRCSLCDFDVCIPCSRRNDAATVGENVLRGDRGVRTETALSTGGYFKRSMQIAKRELPLLAVSFFLLAMSSVSMLLLPHFQGHIIDKVIPDQDGNYDKAGFSHFIKIYIYLMLAQGAISTLYSAIFTLVSRRLKFSIRNSLFEKILAQDVAYFDGTESGRLISRLTNDLDLMMAPIQSSLSSLLSNVLILFGGLIMCFLKSYRLSMLAFVTVGPISYLWEQYALWSKGLAREMLSYWAEGNSIASQALSHVRTVKAFGCEDKVLGKYSEANKQALDCGVKDAWGNGITSALTGYLDLGSGVLILYYGGLLVYRNEMTVGELVTFQLFWNMMNNAYQNLQGLITSFTRSAAGAEKIFSLWDSHPDIDPMKGDDINWDLEGHLRLDNVNFYYQMRPDNMVLKSFNLDIPAGKTVALVGRSGGGKSTIINLLLRFYDPKEGKVSLDGREYESLKVNQLRGMFGVVTQETELFALTVEENIAYGLNKDEYTMDDVVDAAKKAFAHDFICEMKDGYQTRIGERGNRISGGQRQRIAIARVFLRKPKIILLDEATSALDENSQEAVQKALGNLIVESNSTVVLVAHRLSTVVNADLICVIDKGSVLEQGNHHELVAKGGIYASLVEKQNKKETDLLDQEIKNERGDNGKKPKKIAADDIDSLLEDTTAS